MVLMRHPTTGRLLRAESGLLASTENCCCGCCRSLPDTLYFDTLWCSVASTITLNLLPPTDWLYSCAVPKVNKAWRGTGSIGGTGTGIVEAACADNDIGEATLYFRFDACTGFMDTTCPVVGGGNPTWNGLLLAPTSETNNCAEFSTSGSSAPPGACGPCIETFFRTLHT